jgi:hypothetical protein
VEDLSAESVVTDGNCLFRRFHPLLRIRPYRIMCGHIYKGGLKNVREKIIVYMVIMSK